MSLQYADSHSTLLPVKAVLDRKDSFMNILKPDSYRWALKTALVPMILSATPIQGFAARYTVQEIPTPPQIQTPAGLTARPVCLSINEFGQVACNLEIIETLVPTPIDRHAKAPKIFASYAYSWDSTTNTLKLLSSVNTDTLDKANVINDDGLVAGSTATFTTPPQGAIWFGNPGPSLHGQGVITDLNNSGDYVMNDQLFINNIAASFPGNQLKIQAINSSATAPVKAAGTQAFSTEVGEFGVGRLYRAAPAPTKQKPWFALPDITDGVAVKDLTDNGNFVISGTPNTDGGLVALNCTARTNCQLFSPTVGTSGRITPWISLNSVNKARQAVGTDSGIAILIKPPSAAFPNGKRLNLNLKLQPEALNTGWFLNNATDNNDLGQIIGTGIKGDRKVAFLLTPLVP